MATPVDIPLLDAPAHDGQSVRIKIIPVSGGAGWYPNGIQEMTGGGDGQETSFVKQLGRAAPIAQTRGEYKAEDITLKIVLLWSDEFQEKFGRKHLYTKQFVIVRHVVEPGLPRITHRWEGCRIIKIDDGEAKVGNETLVATYTIRPTEKFRGDYAQHR